MCGLSSNPCNVHGESLLHTICRIGNTNTKTSSASLTDNNNNNNNNNTKSLSYEILQIMIEFGHCDITNCVDDYGRTPLHDACWSIHPCWDILSYLIQTDPTLLVLQDSHSATPFSYIPKQNMNMYIEFISHYKDVFFPDLTGTNSKNNHPPKLPSQLVHQLPNSRPVKDPINPLSYSIARMVASGKITPLELSILQNNHRHNPNDDEDDDDASESSSDDDVSESSSDDDDDDDDDEEVSYMDERDVEDDTSTLATTEDDHFATTQVTTSIDDSRNKNSVLSEDDDDDDDEDDVTSESYSELEEMLQRLNVYDGKKRQDQHHSKTVDEPVLGISRPQYGYEMLNQMKEKKTTPSNNNMIDQSDDQTNDDTYEKPMSSVRIPTIIHPVNDTDPTRQSSVVSVLSSSSPSLSHASKPRNTLINDSNGNNLLEFSV
jgi:hypothetical protein